MKTQITKTITLRPEDFETIKKLAKKDRRSFSNFLVVSSLGKNQLNESENENAIANKSKI